MRFSHLILGVIFCLTPMAALAGQQSVEQLYADAKRQYQSVIQSPHKSRNRSEWQRVARKFENIVETRGSSTRAANARYMLGKLYKNLYIHSRDARDKRESVNHFQQVIIRHPKSSLVDDARRQIAEIRFKDHETIQPASFNRRAESPRLKSGKASKPDSGARLMDIRRFSHEGYTRFVIYLSGRAAFRAERLSGPDRVFVDILGAQPAASAQKRNLYSAGLVKSTRLGDSGAITRVVFDLAAEGVDYSVTPLGGKPYRLVVDFERRGDKVKAPSPAPAAVPRPAPPDAAAPVIAASAAIQTIVIDPGHGGKDPGATGPTGLREKDVTLAIARKLKTALERRGGYKVILTRDSDRFLELNERTVMANSLGADLFVSVHVNASRSRAARGMETYFLSPARSKDEMATAARENMMDNFSPDDAENDLSYIMADMSGTMKINESADLAGRVQRAMVGGVRREYGEAGDKGVKQAMFYVLWRARMPSILVETSFISNREEERRLRSPAYQLKLAESIADGIVGYSTDYQMAMSR